VVPSTGEPVAPPQEQAVPGQGEPRGEEPSAGDRGAADERAGGQVDGGRAADAGEGGTSTSQVPDRGSGEREPHEPPGGSEAEDSRRGAYITEPQKRYDPETGQMVPVYARDEDGNLIYDKDGNPVTQSAMYELDDQGRTVRAEMNDVTLVPKQFRERDQAAQDERSGDSPADHAGHFIASMFGGSPHEYNMAPMQGNELNLSNYKRLENELKTAAQANKTVNFAVQAVYEGDSERPSHFNTIFSIDGQDYAVTFVNQQAQPHMYDRNEPPQPF
jgi:hypothetical protein